GDTPHARPLRLVNLRHGAYALSGRQEAGEPHAAQQVREPRVGADPEGRAPLRIGPVQPVERAFSPPEPPVNEGERIGATYSRPARSRSSWRTRSASARRPSVPWRLLGTVDGAAEGLGLGPAHRPPFDQVVE